MASTSSSLTSRFSQSSPSVTVSATSALPSHTNLPLPTPRNANPVVAFIIGLAIIILASILNAAGLNLTKLDHVRTSVIPKSQRRRDWLRPLWLLGMVLYILSQLIGSTLALEYMRAEYVAPLGSMSLVFNFLFARFLVGTPVTNKDIYGTIIVVVGVIGIVAFGSINSGLTSETDVAHITYLWRRPGWLGYFFCMSIALFVVGVGVVRLDAVLAERGEEEVAISETELPLGMMNGGRGRGRGRVGPKADTFLGKMRVAWTTTMTWVKDVLEQWAARKDDKQIAWTLGIGWACLGGGLAGGCLVFAKATVKLISGSVSHQNPGNQFGHAAPIFMIILLCITAVLQIVCLNRGLRVYDSTLVVPVFYSIYTATGFLNSLIFNDEVDSYKFWTLFFIFASMLVLISGVVLLTHKKTEPAIVAPNSAAVPSFRSRRGGRTEGEAGEHMEDERVEGDGETAEFWIGEDSDEEEGSSHQPRPRSRRGGKAENGLGRGGGRGRGRGEERVGLIEPAEDENATVQRRSASSDATLSRDDDPFRDEMDEFGEWEDAGMGAR